jgi:hypothetical protein
MRMSLPVLDVRTNTTRGQQEKGASGGQSIEHLACARRWTYSLVTWQTVLFWPVHSHLMAGLAVGLSSILVASVAMPVQGSPLMFHPDDAVTPSLANNAFTAAAATSQGKTGFRLPARMQQLPSPWHDRIRTDGDEEDP